MSEHEHNGAAPLGRLELGQALSAIESGPRQGVIGGIMLSQKAQKLCAVTAAHVFVRGRRGRCALGPDGVAFVDERAPDPEKRIGVYWSISNALGVAEIPPRVEIDLDSAASWLQLETPCDPLKVLGGIVSLHIPGEGSRTGRVVAVGAPITLSSADDGVISMYGAIEIHALGDDAAFMQPEDAGAAVYAADDTLLGFLLAVDDGAAFVVPAVTAFEELSLQVPTLDMLIEHNERIRDVSSACPAEREPEPILAVIYSFAKNIRGASVRYQRAMGG